MCVVPVGYALSTVRRLEVWSEKCDKGTDPMACKMKDKGVAFNVVNSLSIVFAFVSIVIIACMSKNKGKSNINCTRMCTSTLPIRICLLIAALLQLASIAIWEIDSPIHDHHFDEITNKDGREPKYFLFATAFNILNFVGFFIVASVYKQ